MALPVNTDLDTNLSGPSEVGLALKRGLNSVFGQPGGGGIPAVNRPAGMTPPNGFSKTPAPSAPTPPLGYRLRRMGGQINSALTNAYNGAVDWTSRNAIEPMMNVATSPQVQTSPSVAQAQADAAPASQPQAQPAQAPVQQSGQSAMLPGNLRVNVDPNGSYVQASDPEAMARVQAGMNGQHSGTLSIINNDQTASSLDKMQAHREGMARLRAGLPYDAAEAQAFVNRQLAGNLMDIATGNSQVPRKDKFSRQMAAGLLGQMNQNDIAQGNNLAQQYQNMLQFENQKALKDKEIEAADRRASLPKFKMFQPPSYVDPESGQEVVPPPMMYDQGSGQIINSPVPQVSQTQAQIPSGMKQVGTYQGRPVFEDAKGNRFTNE